MPTTTTPPRRSTRSGGGIPPPSPIVAPRAPPRDPPPADDADAEEVEGRADAADADEVVAAALEPSGGDDGVGVGERGRDAAADATDAAPEAEAEAKAVKAEVEGGVDAAADAAAAKAEEPAPAGAGDAEEASAEAAAAGAGGDAFRPPPALPPLVPPAAGDDAEETDEAKAKAPEEASVATGGEDGEEYGGDTAQGDDTERGRKRPLPDDSGGETPTSQTAGAGVKEESTLPSADPPPAAPAEPPAPKQETLPPAPKRPRKARKEFNAKEKMAILAELDGPNPPSVPELLAKHGVSKSSLHRWRQPEKRERLVEMASGRKRDMHDHLRRIKLGLQAFCTDNLGRPENERMAITSTLLALKAHQIRDELLRSNEEAAKKDDLPNMLLDDEVKALKSFKASKSWSCAIGNKLGSLAGKNPMAWSEKSKANTAAYLDAHATSPPKPKKQRVEFTAQEKLAILEELDAALDRCRKEGRPLVTIDDFCKEHRTSKSSLHRWRQQHRSGKLAQLAARGSGFADSKRVFHDKLMNVKRALNDFYEECRAVAGAEEGGEGGAEGGAIGGGRGAYLVNYHTLHARAMVVREVLLDRHRRAVLKRDREIQQRQQTQLREMQIKTEEDVKEALRGMQNPNQIKMVGNDKESDVDGERPQVAGAEGDSDAPAQEPHVALKAEVPADQHSVALKAGEEGEAPPSIDDDSVSDMDIMGKDEVVALEAFKASNTWLRETARKFGWKVDADASHGHRRDFGSPGGMGSMNLVGMTIHTTEMAAEAYHQHDPHHDGHVGIDATGEGQSHPAEHHYPAHGGEPPAHHEGHERVHHADGGGHQEAHGHHPQQHPVDLAPGMAVYGDHGNVMAEVLDDPMVHVEGEVVEAAATDEEGPLVTI
ncbi:hypothetical protein ACHAWF_009748 [Thalassiosira exigua]